MKKAPIIISIVFGSILVTIGLPILVIGYLISDGVNEIKDTFGYANEDVIAYVEEKYELEVDVIQSAERGPKGLFVEDAHVRTLNENDIEFDVHVSSFGRISGDNYEETKKRFDLNQEYENSEIFHGLRQLDFHGITFGEQADDPAFYLALPDGRGFGDVEALQMMFNALPLLKELQEKVDKDDYELEEISIHGAILDINANYASPEDLGNKLAASNIGKFTYQFFTDDKEKAKEIIPKLQKYGFNKEDGPILECYEMVVYDKCNAYSFTLIKDDTDSKFRYDNVEDKELLLQVIKEIKNLKIPIKKLLVNDVYTPDDPENQYDTEESLKKQEDVALFSRRTVEIADLNHIKTIDDIYFEY